MRLIDAVQSTPWAIVPAKLDAIHEVLWARMHDMPLPEAEHYEARLQPDRDRGTSYSRVEQGVAVIEVEGVLAKRMNLFMAISGGTSTELLQRDLRVALADDNIRAILLDVDSPGGTVDGTEALASLVSAARGTKPIIAFGNGVMASAAYWIGSAADEIVVEETAQMGSIGVLLMHYDYSRADEQAGLKRTVLRAGRYKALGNDAEPLSKEAEAYLQEHLDYLYTLFVDAVARNRDVTAETVLENMAEGRIFIGQQAVDAGLADRMGSFETAMELALSRAAGRNNLFITHGGEAPEAKEDADMKITMETLQKEAPELLARIQEQARQEGVDSVDVAAFEADARKAGAKDERERVLGLTEAKFGVEESAAVRKAAEGGCSVELFQSMLEALGPGQAEEMPKDSDKKDQILEALHEAGAENPGGGGAPAGPADFMEAVRAVKAELRCSNYEAVKEARRRYPQLHDQLTQSKAQGE